MKPKKPDKRTKAEIIDDEHKFRVRATITIILLLFLFLATLTAKIIPPPCIIHETNIIRPTENFCNYVYAHIKLSGESYRIEYRINQEGATQYTLYTDSLDQLTTDVRNLYLNDQITIDQYQCLFAGIKGHELKK